MKTYLCLMVAGLLALSAQAADAVYSAVVTFMGNPANGDSVTVNGKVWTFRSTVTAPGTEVQIGGSTAATADNYYARVQGSPYPDISSAQVTTTIRLAGKANLVITASKVGSWGTVTVTSTTLNRNPVTYPFASRIDRTNMADGVLEGLRDYGLVILPASTGFLSNFVDNAEAQTVAGSKTFTAANVYSNAGQRFVGGALTGVVIRAVYIDNSGGSAGNGIYFKQGGGSIASALAADGNGYPSIYVVSGIGDALTAALNITPSDWNVINAISGDYRYARKSTANTFPALQTFGGGIISPQIVGVATNFTFGATNGWVTNFYVLGLADFSAASSMLITNATGGFTNLWVTNLFSRGRVEVSNTAPEMVFWDTDSDANEKGLAMTMYGGAFVLKTLNDDGSTGEQFMAVFRDGSDVLNVAFGAGVEVTAGVMATSARSYSLGQIAAGTFLGAGAVEVLPPTGLAGGLLLTNVSAEASADPANTVAAWAAAGEWKYRQVGSGTNLRVHNAGAQVVGAGTDYPFTTSYAQVAYGGGGNTLTLGTPGTYLVTAVTTIDNGATANDVYALKFFNATTAADVPNSERQVSSLAASTRAQVTLQNIITVTAANTVHLYGRNTTAARGSVDSEQTTMSYVRLY